MKAKPIVADVKILKNHPKNHSWPQLFTETAKQFCLNTALHGYRFIVLPKRILLERFIWLVICLISLVSALTLLFMAWFNFQKNPVVSVTDSTHYPIWNYEFPAVTVCSYNKISRSKALQLAKNMTVTDGRSPEEIAWDIRLLFQLIYNNDHYIPKENYTRLDRLLRDNRIDVEGALRALAPTCEMIVSCLWKGEEVRCEGLFEQIRTSEGICCAFNYFALKNHSFRGVFANKAAKRPRRVSACGYQTALEMILDNSPDDYFATHIPSIGYRVFVDNPHYFPDNNLQNVLISMKTTNLIGVNPQLTYTTKPMSQLPIAVRHCLFPHEKALMSYERYTFHNCMVECKMNITMKLCGCVPFKYAELKGKNQTIPMCSLEHISCLADNAHLIESLVSNVNFSTTESHQSNIWNQTKCPCLPDCDITDYDVEKSAGVLNRVYSTNDLALFGDVIIANQSVVRVFFSDLIAKRIRWDVVFNWHTLLAYYGGLLGLFVGFSFVSGLEIIYFFTIRVLAGTSNNQKTKSELFKKRRAGKSKIVVQPVTYQALDPNRLIIPSDKEIQQYRMNSYFFN